MQKFFGIEPSYLTLIEKGEYCLSVEKIILLSDIAGVSTDYILKGTINGFSKAEKDVLRGCTEQQIEGVLDIVRKLAKVIRKQSIYEKY